jgi:hypothetical protein
MPYQEPSEDRVVTEREFDLWRSYHDREHALHVTAHDREHVLAEEAIDKAEAILERRLESMNEFREQLKDQASSFVTRESAETQHKSIQEEINRLRDLSLSYMTIERFDREHKTLGDKLSNDIEELNSKLLTEEKVTLKQETEREMVDRISDNNQRINENRKWLIGIAITTVISLITLVAHLLGIF